MQCVDEKVRSILSMDPENFFPPRLFGILSMKERMKIFDEKNKVESRKKEEDSGVCTENDQSMDEQFFELVKKTQQLQMDRNRLSRRVYTLEQQLLTESSKAKKLEAEKAEQEQTIEGDAGETEDEGEARTPEAEDVNQRTGLLEALHKQEVDSLKQEIEYLKQKILELVQESASDGRPIGLPVLEFAMPATDINPICGVTKTEPVYWEEAKKKGTGSKQGYRTGSKEVVKDMVFSDGHSSDTDEISRAKKSNQRNFEADILAEKAKQDEREGKEAAEAAAAAKEAQRLKLVPKEQEERESRSTSKTQNKAKKESRSPSAQPQAEAQPKEPVAQRQVVLAPASSKAEPQAESKPKAESEAKPKPQPKPEPQATTTKPRPQPKPKSQPQLKEKEPKEYRELEQEQ